MLSISASNWSIREAPASPLVPLMPLRSPAALALSRNRPKADAEPSNLGTADAGGKPRGCPLPLQSNERPAVAMYAPSGSTPTNP